MTHGAFSWCVAVGHRRPSVAASEFDIIQSGCQEGKHLVLIMWQLWEEKNHVPMLSPVFQDVSAPLSAVGRRSFTRVRNRSSSRLTVNVLSQCQEG